MIIELAEDVYQICGYPRHSINSYVIDGILVDAGTRYSGRRILRDIARFDIRAHAVTHAHPDHFGASRRICEELGIPLWVGHADAAAVETLGLMYDRFPDHPAPRILSHLQGGPPAAVDRRLREGDRVGSFEVLEVPGHTVGHLAFWRESDRTLLLGDVASGHHPFTGVRGLREPFEFLTADPRGNRKSIARLAGLGPELVCFGHGPALRDADRFADFAAALQ
ncbi:MBL fold metallo-hydrolase [Nocardia sp. NPDC059228]|uniref:MBL fold metallo-hydrolase n=1 Tax=Nocardia sp. NPDC059228 TaxID=3346777 RepID=UPI0036B1C016